MRQWISISLSLFVFCLADFSFAKCRLKSNIKVVSLSGTTTVLFERLGLLNSLKGISVFNPVSAEGFKGRIYPGGIFLSQGSLQEISGGHLYFDESRELSRIFTSLNSVWSAEIKNRGKTPLLSIEDSLEKMSMSLAGCEKETTELIKQATDLQTEILKKIPNTPIVFYLGEIRNGRYPEMIMAHDGIIELLLKEKKLKTYPTDLSYVNWSSKVMRELPKGTLHVALKDSGPDGVKEIKRSPLGVTLYYPGVLTPGFSQLEGFLYLFNSL